MKYLIFAILLSACTISIVLNHSEGQTSDLVDENQDASPTVSPVVSMPGIF